MKKTFDCIERLFVVALAATLVLSLMVGSPGMAKPAAPSGSYIVQGADVDTVSRLVEQYGGVVTSRLAIIQGVGATLPAGAVERLAAHPAVSRIFPNATVRLVANQAAGGNVPATDYPEVVGADVTLAQGTNGSGISVAVVDTGLGWHPGLFKDINGKNVHIVGWKDFVENKIFPHDPNGHGTHVAGIIANTQKDSSGAYNGVAPGVKLVGVRVLDETGAGTYERTIQGIQWVVDHKDSYNIRVMNLSLVSAVQSPYWADPLNQAVMQAWAAGIVVVAAAGNGGPAPMTIGVPGNNPYVITVGAFTDNYTPLDWNDDYLADFSAAGPTLDGFVKPDLLAPGAHMVSTMMPWSYLARNHQANWVTPIYFSMAGTSQATAVTSGVAALVLSHSPNLTPDEVKYRLMVTAFPWVDPQTTDALYSMWQQGAGRLNAVDAVYADISGTANYGMDIQADLAGTIHYEGYSYYDETTGEFKLRSPFDTWGGGYGTWSGGYGTWSGGYGTWSGGYGTWSGGYGTWSGGYGTWSGGYGTWSGGYGTWSGGYGTWSGGYGTWSGGYGTWSGSEPWAGTNLFDPAFVTNFLAGVGPDAATTTTSIGNWVEEP